MTEELKPFIFVEFDEFGSQNYKMSINQITASQLFLMAGIINFQAQQSYMKEQLEYEKSQLAEPTKGIIKP